MKTVYVTKGSTYKRLSNHEAEQTVRAGRGKYVPKSEWKKNVRDYKIDQALADHPIPAKTKKS